MSEFSPLGGNERYGACDDVQGLGKATPQQDSRAAKFEHNASWFCCCSHFAVINARPLVLTDKTPRA